MGTSDVRRCVFISTCAYAVDFHALRCLALDCNGEGGIAYIDMISPRLCSTYVVSGVVPHTLVSVNAQQFYLVVLPARHGNSTHPRRTRRTRLSRGLKIRSDLRDDYLMAARPDH